MGTHKRVLNKSYPMNTNMIGFKGFSKKMLHPCATGHGSLSIRRIYQYMLIVFFLRVLSKL